MIKEDRQNSQSPNGFSLIMVAIFMAVVLAIGFALMNYTISSRKVSKRFESEVNLVQLAESGIQKAIYCLNADTGTYCGGTYGDSYTGEASVSFNGGSYTVTVVGIDGEREITSVGIGPTGDVATIKSAAIKEQSVYTDTVFDYALMIDDEVLIKNGAEILNGPVYSNADLYCSNNAVIEDDAIVTKNGGRIDNCEIGGDAYADKIYDSDIDNDCYYDNTFNKSSCGGTKYSSQPTPPAEPLPTFDVAFWRAQAESGDTISGDYEPTDGSTLGPVKITGKLELNNGVDVIMTGPIWVMDEINMSNNASLTLDSSFGQTGSVVLADHPLDDKGKIEIDNNVVIAGSGEPNSYIMFVSTATDDPAIIIKNNAGAGIYYAPNGGIKLSNNAGAVALAAKYAEIENNSEIIYESGGLLKELEFQTEGESSGWKILSGTWHEL